MGGIHSRNKKLNDIMNKPHQVVFITGAAKRLGRAMALHFAKQKWDVVVHYNQSKEEAQNLVEEIEALGQRAMAIQGDLANEAQTKTLLPQAIAAMGHVDCVVNNASLFEPDTAANFSQTVLDQHMHINTMSPIILAQALHAATPDHEQTCVINLLDQKLYNLNPDYLSYTLSKSALQCATTTLAQALAPRVRVVGVAPGLSLISGEQTAEQFQQAHQQTALGKSSTPQDIAEAVFYAANARAMTGTTLLVDGGQHLIPLPRDVMFMTAPTNQ